MGDCRSLVQIKANEADYSVILLQKLGNRTEDRGHNDTMDWSQECVLHRESGEMRGMEAMNALFCAVSLEFFISCRAMQRKAVI